MPEEDGKARQNESELLPSADGKMTQNTPESMGGSGKISSREGKKDDPFTSTRPSSPEQWMDGLGRLAKERTRKADKDRPLILRYAVAAQHYIAATKLEELKKSAIKGGVEHDVFIPAPSEGKPNLVYKITKPYDRPMQGIYRQYGLLEDENQYLKY